VAGEAFITQRDGEAGGVRDRGGPFPRGERRRPLTADHVQGQPNDQLPDPVCAGHPGERLRVRGERAAAGQRGQRARPERIRPGNRKPDPLRAKVDAKESAHGAVVADGAGLGDAPAKPSTRRSTRASKVGIVVAQLGHSEAVLLPSLGVPIGPAPGRVTPPHERHLQVGERQVQPVGERPVGT
jgi:hypothetical protein